jgi:hypothetical protein
VRQFDILVLALGGRMRFDLLKRREFMGYRGVIGSFMLTAAM